eukprot:5881812-Amphidinium_carterae.1
MDIGTDQTNADTGPAHLQESLRDIITQCLVHLDVADSRLEPMLTCLEQLITSFEREMKLDVSSAASGHQWGRMKAVVVAANAPEPSLSTSRKTSNQGSAA